MFTKIDVSKKKRQPNPKPAPVQQRVLDLFHEADEARRPMPTFREIGDALNIASTNGVADHIKALIRKGYIAAPTKPTSRSHLLTNKARTERYHAKRREKQAQREEADL